MTKDSLFDKVMSQTLNITIEEWLDKTERMDSEQYQYITGKLISLDESEFNKGLQEFNSI